MCCSSGWASAATRCPDSSGAPSACPFPSIWLSVRRRLDRGVHRVLYTRNFLRTMRRKVRRQGPPLPGFVDVEAAGRARTFAEYDRVVTAPLNGFADELDYWRRASSGPYLAGIRRPALLISALDDPLVPQEALPDPTRLPAQVTAEFVPNGRSRRLPRSRLAVAVDLVGGASGP